MAKENYVVKCLDGINAGKCLEQCCGGFQGVTYNKDEMRMFTKEGAESEAEYCTKHNPKIKWVAELFS